jgi:hypothetical protein
MKILQKSRVVIVLGVLAVIFAAFALVLFLIIGNRGLVGTWEFIEERIYRDGHFSSLNHLDSGEYLTYEFRRNGQLIIYRSYWGTEIMGWEILDDGILYLSGFGEVPYALNDYELKLLIESGLWFGDFLEITFIFHRMR